MKTTATKQIPENYVSFWKVNFDSAKATIIANIAAVFAFFLFGYVFAVAALLIRPHDLYRLATCTIPLSAPILLRRFPRHTDRVPSPASMIVLHAREKCKKDLEEQPAGYSSIRDMRIEKAMNSLAVPFVLQSFRVLFLMRDF